MDVARTSTPAEGEEPEVTIETETINSMKALWTRSKDEVSEDEYKEFYKHVSHAWDEPLEVIPMRPKVLSNTKRCCSFRRRRRSISSCVSARPASTSTSSASSSWTTVKSWCPITCASSRVSSTHKTSRSTSLREILQQDRQIAAIRRRLTKKVLSTIKDMKANEPEKYSTFWTEFGRALKEGLMADADNRKTLLDISSFASTNSEEGVTTLAEYVERMKDGQEQIYFMTGESRHLIESSPHMEAFKAKGLEVLVLTDPGGRDVGRRSLGPSTARPSSRSPRARSTSTPRTRRRRPKAEREEKEKEFGALLTWLTETLSDDIKETRLSTRLTTSAACIVGDAFSMSPTLEKMYKASGQPVPTQQAHSRAQPGASACLGSAGGAGRQ